MDGGPPAMLDGALARFIDEGHLGRQLRRSRRTYAARHQTVVRELQRLAPPDARVLPTQTGLHITLLTPRAPADEVLRKRAAQQELIFSTLRRTYQFSDGQPGIIVGFGAIDTTEVPTAIERLMAAHDDSPSQRSRPTRARALRRMIDRRGAERYRSAP